MAAKIIRQAADGKRYNGPSDGHCLNPLINPNIIEQGQWYQGPTALQR